LIRFNTIFDHLVVAYFLGHPVYGVPPPGEYIGHCGATLGLCPRWLCTDDDDDDQINVEHWFRWITSFLRVKRWV